MLCCKVELPLHFHTFPTTDPKAREQASGQVRRAALFTGVAAFQMGLIHIIAAMIGANGLRCMTNSVSEGGLRTFQINHQGTKGTKTKLLTGSTG